MTLYQGGCFFFFFLALFIASNPSRHGFQKTRNGKFINHLSIMIEKEGGGMGKFKVKYLDLGCIWGKRGFKREGGKVLSN